MWMEQETSGVSNWETIHEVLELDRVGFVAQITLLLVVVDVDLDVGNERVPDRMTTRRWKVSQSRERAEMDSEEVGRERAVHRTGLGDEKR